MEKAAIVHFTNKSEKRPVYNEKALAALKKLASAHGYDDVDIYCDKSLLRCERSEFDQFLSCYEQYTALFTKDFYHIAENTKTCMSLLKDFREKGLNIYTLKDGSFLWTDVPLDKPLRVVTYTCQYGTPRELDEAIPIKNDIFKHFIKNKTNWILTDQYFDKCKHQTDEVQVQIREIINNKDSYDLLLVHAIQDVHWRTSKFCKIRTELGLDIYSLQDGFLKFEKG